MEPDVTAPLSREQLARLLYGAWEDDPARPRRLWADMMARKQAPWLALADAVWPLLADARRQAVEEYSAWIERYAFHPDSCAITEHERHSPYNRKKPKPACTCGLVALLPPAPRSGDKEPQ